MKANVKGTAKYFYILLGIILRFAVMFLGHNNDFESYCIVGEIVSSSGNVYAETYRYNYGPIFCWIQGLCWWIAHLFEANGILIFRILIVSVLTATEIGILFFLNPVSVFITGFHNQFDNIAVLLGLLTCSFYSEEEKLSFKDLEFIVLFSLCLITKHIFFIFPVWILVKKGLPLKKRCLYSFMPVLLFLTSFLPYCIKNQEALHGIIKNVFLYRSINNAPLLKMVYVFLRVPDNLFFIIYILIMVILGYIVRKKDYQYTVIFYLISMVTFASAIANQYLVIPIVSLCVLSKGICKYMYMGYAIMFLIFNDCGLNLGAAIPLFSNPKYNIIRTLLAGGGAYTILVWILFAVVLKEIITMRSKIFFDS